jgi:hypothetical protein
MRADGEPGRGTYPVARRQGGKLHTAAGEECVGSDEEGIEALTVVRRHGFPCGDYQRALGQKCDGFKIILKIVSERIESTVCNECIPLADYQSVPIGRSAANAADADAPVRTRYAFNDDRLAK